MPEGRKFVERKIRTAVSNFVLLRLIVMDSSNTENERIRVLDLETPRAAPRATDIVPASDLVRKLLAELSKIRDENKQLRKEMEDLVLTTRRKTKLSQKSRDYDSECSVSSYFRKF